PPLVFMRARKPCVFLRWRLRGRYVRFMDREPQGAAKVRLRGGTKDAAAYGKGVRPVKSRGGWKRARREGFPRVKSGCVTAFISLAALPITGPDHPDRSTQGCRCDLKALSITGHTITATFRPSGSRCSSGCATSRVR